LAEVEKSQTATIARGRVSGFHVQEAEARVAYLEDELAELSQHEAA